MSFDLKLFGSKLRKCRDQLQWELGDIEQRTGITTYRLDAFEKGLTEPSGDEVLILSDALKQDYHYFISNEQRSATDNVDILYRKFGKLISKDDRWSIQEFIYLCECEEFVLRVTEHKGQEFSFRTQGTYFKGHGKDGAIALRQFLNLRENQIASDLYSEMRRIGLHVFRRRLKNSSISGLFISHPFAGKCILVNYEEDIFRQNFTIAHETGHAIFDYEALVNVSFEGENNIDLKEVRANTFASELLVPRGILNSLRGRVITEEIIRSAALKLKVNPQVILIVLTSEGIISQIEADRLGRIKIPKEDKLDPELAGLSEKIRNVKKVILERGLSSSYIRSCHEAYAKSMISANKLAEMLLTTDTELPALLSLFNLKLI